MTETTFQRSAVRSSVVGRREVWHYPPIGPYSVLAALGRCNSGYKYLSVFRSSFGFDDASWSEQASGLVSDEFGLRLEFVGDRVLRFFGVGPQEAGRHGSTRRVCTDLGSQGDGQLPGEGALLGLLQGRISTGGDADMNRVALLVLDVHTATWGLYTGPLARWAKDALDPGVPPSPPIKEGATTDSDDLPEKPRPCQVCAAQGRWPIGLGRWYTCPSCAGTGTEGNGPGGAATVRKYADPETGESKTLRPGPQPEGMGPPGPLATKIRNFMSGLTDDQLDALRMALPPPWWDHIHAAVMESDDESTAWVLGYMAQVTAAAAGMAARTEDRLEQELADLRSTDLRSTERLGDAMLIRTRFDYWPSAARGNARVEIYRADLPRVPNVGEVINIKGNPYIVHARGWAIGDDEDGTGKLYAFVGVFKAGEFTT